MSEFEQLGSGALEPAPVAQLDTHFTLDNSIILEYSNAIAGFRYGPYQGEIFEGGELVIHGYVEAEIFGLQSESSVIYLPPMIMQEIQRLTDEYWQAYDELNGVEDSFGTSLISPTQII